MKNIKRILLMLLALTLLFTLIACNGGGDDTCKHEDEDEDGICDLCEICLEHIDDDEDGLCDNCDAELEDEGEGEGISLIADGEILFQIVVQTQTVPDLKEALLYCMQDILAGDAVGEMRVTQIQQIRQLVIGAESLAGRRGNDDAPGGIGLQDGLDLLKLLRSRYRGPAEFCNFDSHAFLLSRRF